jgi:xylose dehydrogenase (NAD/NADP)
LDSVAHCVLAGTSPESDGEDGLRDLWVLDAAYEAADTGRRSGLRAIERDPTRRGVERNPDGEEGSNGSMPGTGRPGVARRARSL